MSKKKKERLKIPYGRLSIESERSKHYDKKKSRHSCGRTRHTNSNTYGAYTNRDNGKVTTSYTHIHLDPEWKQEINIEMQKI